VSLELAKRERWTGATSQSSAWTCICIATSSLTPSLTPS